MKGRISFGLAALAALSALAAVAYAVNVPIPTAPTVDPSNVGTGFLTRGTQIDSASVASFARAIKQSQGSTAVLQHVRFADGQSTGWHTHPGPAIVLVASGRLDFVSDTCEVTSYPAGTGFVDQGFDNVHEAHAVGATDFYVLYYLPDSASLVREDSEPRC